MTDAANADRKSMDSPRKFRFTLGHLLIALIPFAFILWAIGFMLRDSQMFVLVTSILPLAVPATTGALCDGWRGLGRGVLVGIWTYTVIILLLVTITSVILLAHTLWHR